MNPWVRVCVKLSAFAFAVFFIFFFVVHGFRYSGAAGFRSKNAFYQAQFRSNEQEIIFGGQRYVASDYQVQLYNVDAGCYDIQYRTDTYKQCIKDNQVLFDTFVHVVGITGYTDDPLKPCAMIDRHARGEYTVGGLTYAKPIQAVFTARDVPFLQVDDTLYACSPDFTTCRTLMALSGDVVCSTKQGLVYNQSGSLFMAELD